MERMRNPTNATALAILAASAILGTAVVGSAIVYAPDSAPSPAPAPTEATEAPLSGFAYSLDALPACEWEDSTDCYWDADVQGNGEGRSFVDIAGTAYYVD